MVRWRRGTPKARVFPDPVLALPHTSRPARASATVIDWMAKVVVMPWAGKGLDQGRIDAQGGKGRGAGGVVPLGVRGQVGTVDDPV